MGRRRRSSRSPPRGDRSDRRRRGKTDIIDAEAGVAGGFERPTGIAFAPGEEWLYVADSRASTIQRFRCDGERLGEGEPFVLGAAPSLDSMALDEDGRIWIGALDGVHCYDPDGILLGKIRLPDAASHVEFGGAECNVLYVCATTALCAFMLTVRGLTAAER